MTGGRIVKEARRRAGLSQAELATRLGTTQSAVARWEAGRVSPSLDTVVRAVRSAGLELHFSIAAPDPDHDRLIAHSLTLGPTDRIAALRERSEVEHQLRGAARR